MSIIYQKDTLSHIRSRLFPYLFCNYVRRLWVVKCEFVWWSVFPKLKLKSCYISFYILEWSFVVRFYYSIFCSGMIEVLLVLKIKTSGRYFPNIFSVRTTIFTIAVIFTILPLWFRLRFFIFFPPRWFPDDNFRTPWRIDFKLSPVVGHNFLLSVSFLAAVRRLHVCPLTFL